MNNRFRGSHVTPKKVRAAMDELSSLAAEQATFTPDKDIRFALDLSYTFPSMRGDVDGPVKRTIDAVFRGFRRRIDSSFVNDGRVTHVRAKKFVGTPATVVEVWSFLHGEDISEHLRRLEMGEKTGN